MLSVEVAGKFKKDLSRLKKRGKNLDKLEVLIEKLRAEEPLAPKHCPHILSGDWDGFWELHIEPDWLLIYAIDDETLFLIRTGSHSDLF